MEINLEKSTGLLPSFCEVETVPEPFTTGVGKDETSGLQAANKASNGKNFNGL
jgi:hypothetical protein